MLDLDNYLSLLKDKIGIYLQYDTRIDKTKYTYEKNFKEYLEQQLNDIFFIYYNNFYIIFKNIYTVNRPIFDNFFNLNIIIRNFITELSIRIINKNELMLQKISKSIDKYETISGIDNNLSIPSNNNFVFINLSLNIVNTKIAIYDELYNYFKDKTFSDKGIDGAQFVYLRDTSGTKQTETKNKITEIINTINSQKNSDITSIQNLKTQYYDTPTITNSILGEDYNVYSDSSGMISKKFYLKTGYREVKLIEKEHVYEKVEEIKTNQSINKIYSKVTKDSLLTNDEIIIVDNEFMINGIHLNDDKYLEYVSKHVLTKDYDFYYIENYNEFRVNREIVVNLDGKIIATKHVDSSQEYYTFETYNSSTTIINDDTFFLEPIDTNSFDLDNLKEVVIKKKNTDEYIKGEITNLDIINFNVNDTITINGDISDTISDVITAENSYKIINTNYRNAFVIAPINNTLEESFTTNKGYETQCYFTIKKQLINVTLEDDNIFRCKKINIKENQKIILKQKNSEIFDSEFYFKANYEDCYDEESNSYIFKFTIVTVTETNTYFYLKDNNDNTVEMNMNNIDYDFDETLEFLSITEIKNLKCIEQYGKYIVNTYCTFNGYLLSSYKETDYIYKTKLDKENVTTSEDYIIEQHGKNRLVTNLSYDSSTNSYNYTQNIKYIANTYMYIDKVTKILVPFPTIGTFYFIAKKNSSTRLPIKKYNKSTAQVVHLAQELVLTDFDENTFKQKTKLSSYVSVPFDNIIIGKEYLFKTTSIDKKDISDITFSDNWYVVTEINDDNTISVIYSYNNEIGDNTQSITISLDNIDILEYNNTYEDTTKIIEDITYFYCDNMPISEQNDGTLNYDEYIYYSNPYTANKKAEISEEFWDNFENVRDKLGTFQNSFTKDVDRTISNTIDNLLDNDKYYTESNINGFDIYDKTLNGDIKTNRYFRFSHAIVPPDLIKTYQVINDVLKFKIDVGFDGEIIYESIDNDNYNIRKIKTYKHDQIVELEEGGKKTKAITVNEFLSILEEKQTTSSRFDFKTDKKNDGIAIIYLNNKKYELFESGYEYDSDNNEYYITFKIRQIFTTKKYDINSIQTENIPETNLNKSVIFVLNNAEGESFIPCMVLKFIFYVISSIVCAFIAVKLGLVAATGTLTALTINAIAQSLAGVLADEVISNGLEIMLEAMETKPIIEMTREQIVTEYEAEYRTYIANKHKIPIENTYAVDNKLISYISHNKNITIIPSPNINQAIDIVSDEEISYDFLANTIREIDGTGYNFIQKQAISASNTASVTTKFIFNKLIVVTSKKTIEVGQRASTYIQRASTSGRILRNSISVTTHKPKTLYGKPKTSLITRGKNTIKGSFSWKNIKNAGITAFLTSVADGLLYIFGICNTPGLIETAIWEMVKLSDPTKFGDPPRLRNNNRANYKPLIFRTNSETYDIYSNPTLRDRDYIFLRYSPREKNYLYFVLDDSNNLYKTTFNLSDFSNKKLKIHRADADGYYCELYNLDSIDINNDNYNRKTYGRNDLVGQNNNSVINILQNSGKYQLLEFEVRTKLDISFEYETIVNGGFKSGYSLRLNSVYNIDSSDIISNDYIRVDDLKNKIAKSTNISSMFNTNTNMYFQYYNTSEVALPVISSINKSKLNDRYVNSRYPNRDYRYISIDDDEIYTLNISQQIGINSVNETLTSRFNDVNNITQYTSIPSNLSITGYPYTFCTNDNTKIQIYIDSSEKHYIALKPNNDNYSNCKYHQPSKRIVTRQYNSKEATSEGRTTNFLWFGNGDRGNRAGLIYKLNNINMPCENFINTEYKIETNEQKFEVILKLREDSIAYYLGLLSSRFSTSYLLTDYETSENFYLVFFANYASDIIQIKHSYFENNTITPNEYYLSTLKFTTSSSSYSSAINDTSITLDLRKLSKKKLHFVNSKLTIIKYVNFTRNKNRFYFYLFKNFRTLNDVIPVLNDESSSELEEFEIKWYTNKHRNLLNENFNTKQNTTGTSEIIISPPNNLSRRLEIGECRTYVNLRVKGRSLALAYYDNNSNESIDNDNYFNIYIYYPYQTNPDNSVNVINEVQDDITKNNLAYEVVYQLNTNDIPLLGKRFTNNSGYILKNKCDLVNRDYYLILGYTIINDDDDSFSVDNLLHIDTDNFENTGSIKTYLLSNYKFKAYDNATLLELKNKFS